MQLGYMAAEKRAFLEDGIVAVFDRAQQFGLSFISQRPRPVEGSRQRDLRFREAALSSGQAPAWARP
jgi:hypothetical protein